MDNPSRRRLLVAGIGGAALGLVNTHSAAGANGPASVPPSGYTAADAELLGIVQAVELTVRDLYQTAIEGGADDEVYRGIRDNHQAYGYLIAGLVGLTARGRRNEELYEQLVGGFDGASGPDLATAAYDVESTLVATHSELLGQLEGVDGARAIASVLVVEAQHCTVLADLAGLGEDLDALLLNEAAALALAPVGEE